MITVHICNLNIVIDVIIEDAFLVIDALHYISCIQIGLSSFKIERLNEQQ